MPTVAFVVNPTLLRDPRGFVRRCRNAARERGWDPAFAETSSADHGLAAARDAAAAGARLVFAAGGDGTLRACAQALADTGVPLAIVPLGTANLTARALGVPGRAGPAIDVGFDAPDRRIDLAQAEDLGDGGRGLSFLAMAGIGLDAAVVAAARPHVKRHLGWVAYAVAGAAHLWLPPHHFTIRLDGREPLTRRARCVVVGNAGLLPGGFGLLPGAQLDDGRLDVGVLAPAGLLGWPLVAARVLTRGRRQDRHLERFQARRVEITAAAELPRQVDGEIVAPGRGLSVSVRAGALLVRSPGKG